MYRTHGSTVAHNVSDQCLYGYWGCEDSNEVLVDNVDEHMRAVNQIVTENHDVAPCPFHAALLESYGSHETPQSSPLNSFLAEGVASQHAVFCRPDTGVQIERRSERKSENPGNAKFIIRFK